MVIKLKEGYQDESFVAYYNGELFYTGQLDSNFSDTIQKLIRKDGSAYKSVCDYLRSSGVEDFDCKDDFNISYLLSELMYYEAVDGEDYWNFDGFEIFPEYELDESIIRITESNDLTRSERINLITSIIEDLEYKDINGITDSITDRMDTYDLTKKEAVRDGYISYFTTYFENDEDGCSFVEKYYGDDTDTFYEELETACEKYVSTFSSDVIDSFFEYDDPLNPGSMDFWINGFPRSYR